MHLRWIATLTSCLLGLASAQSLPDPLTLANGKPVKDAAIWTKQRRPELMRLFETNIYGRSPARPAKPLFEILNVDDQALGGKAIRKQVRVWLAGKEGGPKMDLLIYLPRGVARAPVFVSLNFNGNQTVSADPGITVASSWVSPKSDQARGAATSRWPVEHILERGYALATANYGDIEPDFNGGFEHSVRKAYPAPGPDGWGAIAAWAWGMSRALDYLETEPAVNAKRAAGVGHSRLGKATLWAGASDPRFAVVISNDSGEGGAALSRRKSGERVKDLNRAFPHWFAPNYAKFNDREEDLPVDMHELIALIAPRPVYVASAIEDQWADPLGEFLSAKAASPVYRLLGQEGLAATEMPAVHQPVLSRIGYHVRAGKHDITLYDWDRFMDFTDKWMR